MGRMWIEGFLDQGVDQTKALVLHLRNNHYPPVPLAMLPVCEEAIKNAKNDEWDKLIALPKPITWRGKNKAPTSEVITAHHLEVFLEQE